MKIDFSEPFSYSTIRSVKDISPKTVRTTWHKFIEKVKNPKIQKNKGGPAWIPAIFEGKRRDSDVVEVTGFMCDFDNKHGNKVTSGVIKKRLKHIRYVAHTSYSHTPKHQKWRVIIPLDKPLSAPHYIWMFHYFNKLFGGELDASKKSPSNLFFLPSCRSKKNYRCFVNKDARRFTFEDTGIPLRFPREFAKDPNLQRRWDGDTTGLKDTSRSGLLHSFVSLMANRGYSEQEIRAVMDYWRGGRNTSRDIDYSLSKVKTETFPDVRIITLDQVTRKKVDWLWYPYIPLGKITLLSGDPSVGKSYIGLSIASHLSKGRRLPLTKQRVHGSSLIISAEDDLEDTIAPRLDAMGADSSKIAAVKGLFILSETGMAELSNMIHRIHPMFIFIDPLSAYIDAETDTSKENQVRFLMTRLQEIAERHHCAVMCVRHLTKGTRDRAIYRGQGSIAFTATVRSELMAGDIDGDKILAHAKHNVGPKGATIEYDLTDTGKIPSLVWGEESELTVEDLNLPEAKSNKGKTEKAQEFLKDILANGPVEAEKIRKAAERESISHRTLRRACQTMGIKHKRIGGMKGEWYWELQDERA